MTTPPIEITGPNVAVSLSVKYERHRRLAPVADLCIRTAFDG
jgi:hypothetical protein